MTVFTTAEVAEQLRCSRTKVRAEAARLGLGSNFGGRAGFRYTEADIDALWDAMRPVQPVAQRRRRRRAA